MDGKRLKVARILGAHGVKGAVKLQVFLENAEMLGTLNIEDEGGKPVRLSLQGLSGKALVARIAGIETREGAEALSKADLFIPRDALPAPEADEFYAADLIGLAAFGADGRHLGEVVAVQDFGAGPLLEVKPHKGATVLVPFTAETVPVIDMAAGRLSLVLAPGLWPED